MKNLKIELSPCWIVEGWAKEMQIALGYRVNELHEGSWHSDKYLILQDGIYKIISSKYVFNNLLDAEKALEKERKSYLEFCRKQVKEYNETIDDLTT